MVFGRIYTSKAVKGLKVRFEIHVIGKGK